MGMTPLFRKGHYEVIADILFAHLDALIHDYDHSLELVDVFAVLFKVDNPQFDTDKFRKAVTGGNKNTQGR